MSAYDQHEELNHIEAALPSNFIGQDAYILKSADALMLDEMEVRSDTSLTHINGQRLSSSLPPQPWGGHFATASSSHFRRGELRVDESTLAHRAAALRQLNGNPRGNPRKHRQTKSIPSRSSLASQPVLVRTYSANVSSQSPSISQPSPPPSRGTRMSRRPELPPVHEFSIDGILQAIEPDIQGTIDSIAEICGRSRLALANEYESHMPPQGEIRATRIPLDRPLLPVEEASSSNERLAGEGVFIVGDDTSVADSRLHGGSAAYGSLLRTASLAGGYGRRSDPSWRNTSMPIEPHTPRSVSVPDASINVGESAFPSPPFLRDRAPRSKSASWALLGRNVHDPNHDRTRGIVTMPVVSEILLDAGANGTPAQSLPIVSEAGRNYPLYTFDEQPHFEALQANISPSRLRALQTRVQNDFQSWIAWLNRDRRDQDRQSAETRLRLILEHQNIPGVAEDELEHSEQDP